MNIAHAIAQKLFESGIRLHDEFDIGALVLTPDHLRVELARLYIDGRTIPLDVEVNSVTAKQMGPEQAYYRAAFYQLQSDDDFSVDVDAELVEIQKINVAESRPMLLREQAA
jgi:hypothetical protein